MIEAVGRQQLEFRAPGVLQDARGVVVGSQAVLLVYSFDRLVSVLRLLSEEPALLEMLPTLRIEEVRNPLGARGYLLRWACGESRTLDRCARAAALCLGGLYVGAERHFVAYRDRRAPLGYDVAELASDGGDYLLYGAAATQAYVRVAELPLPHVLLRLQLLPCPGGALAALRRFQQGVAGEEALWLLLPMGLLLRTLRFLWQRGIEASVALPDPLPAVTERPSTSERGKDVKQALVQLPGKALQSATTAAHVRLLLELPGVRALRPLSEHLAVELGHAHPLHLLSFARLFDKEARHLFLAGGRVTSALTLPATPFVPAERMIELHYGAPGSAGTPDEKALRLRPAERQPVFGTSPPPLQLRLRLCVEPTVGEPPVATLVPWTQARTLGRLLCLLPPALFPELRAVCLDEGILLSGDSGAVASLPLGRLLYAAAPKVLVPLGWALVPRLRGDILRSKLEAAVKNAGDAGAQADLDEPYVVFLPGTAPFALRKELFLPASGPLISRLLVSEWAGEQRTPPPAAPAEPTVINDPLGVLWPLWGGPRAAAPVPKGGDKKDGGR